MQQEWQALTEHKRKQYGCSRLHQWPNAGPALMSTSLGRLVFASGHPQCLLSECTLAHGCEKNCSMTASCCGAKIQAICLNMQSGCRLIDG